MEAILAVQVVLQLFQVLLPQAVAVEAKVNLVPVVLEKMVVQVEVEGVQILLLPLEEVATNLLFLLLKEVLVVLQLQILIEPVAAEVEVVLQVPTQIVVVEVVLAVLALQQI